MSASDEQPEVDGLARSIGSLFDGDEETAADGAVPARGSGDSQAPPPDAGRHEESGSDAADGDVGAPEGLELGADLFEDSEDPIERALTEGLMGSMEAELQAAAEPPRAEPEPEPEPVPEAAPAPTSEPEPEAISVPEAPAEPDPVVDPEPAPAPQAEAAPEPEPEPTPEPESAAGPTPVPEPEPESRTVAADPEALAAAVGRFLDAPPPEREEQAPEIRALATALREVNALDSLADAVERLALAGTEPDPTAIETAGFLLTPGVASRIAARLGQSRDEERRTQLMIVCKRAGHEMALAISDAMSATNDRHARSVFVETMVLMGRASMPVIEEMAEDPRWFVVRNAIAVLGDVGGDRSIEVVTASLAHTDARVRREALLALAKLGGEDAAMLVYGMLEDSDRDVRLAAAMAAGALKVERALKPLLALLEDESEDDVVVAILQALGLLGDPGAVNTIEKRAVGSFFSKPPAEVRIAAYRALHRIGTPHAKEVVRDALDDKDLQVKAAVRRLLGHD